jgi:hypothetical protein
LGLVLAGFTALVIAGYILIVIYHIFKVRHPGFLGPIALGLSCGVIYEMSQLQRKRQIMKAVTGTDFVDNQWGFGQVIAIFLWIPLLIQTLYYTCSMPLTTRQCNTRMITDFYWQLQPMHTLNRRNKLNSDSPVIVADHAINAC